MKSYDDAIKYINEQEKLPIDYCKVGNDSKILIVSFAGFWKNYYDRKSSLLKLRYERNDFDVLYFAKKKTWYLCGLDGIGKNINHTIEFLRIEFNKYDKIICVGISMGGYASILFGSLLNVNYVIATRPQTDLEYITDKCSSRNGKCKSHELWKASIGLSKIIDSQSFQKYKNLNKIINDSTVYYYIGFYEDRDGWHDSHHYNNVKNFKNMILHGTRKTDEIIPLLTKILDE